MDMDMDNAILAIVAFLFIMAVFIVIGRMFKTEERKDKHPIAPTPTNPPSTPTQPPRGPVRPPREFPEPEEPPVEEPPVDDDDDDDDDDDTDEHSIDDGTKRR